LKFEKKFRMKYKESGGFAPVDIKYGRRQHEAKEIYCPAQSAL
jgi:hypothetical protein